MNCWTPCIVSIGGGCLSSCVPRCSAEVDSAGKDVAAADASAVRLPPKARGGTAWGRLGCDFDTTGPDLLLAASFGSAGGFDGTFGLLRCCSARRRKLRGDGGRPGLTAEGDGSIAAAEAVPCEFSTAVCAAILRAKAMMPEPAAVAS